MDAVSRSQRPSRVRIAFPLVFLVLAVLTTPVTAQQLSIDRQRITGHVSSDTRATETFTIENTADYTIHVTLTPRQGQTAAKTPKMDAQTPQKQVTADAPDSDEDLRKAAQEQDTVQVIVTLRHQADGAGKTLDSGAMDAITRKKRQFLDELPAREVRVSRMMEGFPTVSLRVTAQGLEAIQAHPIVKHVSRDRPASPLLQESTERIGAPNIWNQGYTGGGQTIVILDTGFDTDHPFFADRIVEEACFSGGSGESLCPEGERTITGPGTASKMGNGHGTHVAGIAAGNGNYRSDITHGVAPEADIVAIQVFSETADGLKAAREDYISALQYVYRELRPNYDIAAVNMSIGTEDWHTTSHCGDHSAASIIRLLWNAGIPTVIASGNEHQKSAVSSPGCIPEAITVGASGAGEVTNFSNNSYLVDLLAPGDQIYSSIPRSTGSSFGEQYGTSQAAAHVSGAFAALASQQPQTPVQTLREMLVASGHRMKDVNSIEKPHLALDRALNYLPWFTIDDADYHESLAPGESWTVAVTLDGTVLPDSPAGTGYSGAIDITSTDPTAPTQTISVDLSTESPEVTTSASDLKAGWNLIGLAVRPESASIDELFPSSSPNATYTWQQRYVPSTSAAVGQGYWVHFPEQSSTSVAGDRLTEVSWQLDEGWNLVSGPDCEDALTRTEVETFGNIVTYDSMYKWDTEKGEYVMAGILDPTEGYWLHAYKAGEIAIDCSGSTRIQGGKRGTHADANIDPGPPPRPPASMDETPSTRPERFALHGNYPNPFNPSTTIRFDLPEEASVTVQIVNMLGQSVRTISREQMGAGSQSIQVDGTSLPAGTYIYRITAQMPERAATSTGTMTLVK